MKPFVKLAAWIKQKTNCRTWVIESTFVGIVLAAVWVFGFLYDGKSWIELIGSAAVFFTFKHASVAARMEESEAERAKTGSHFVECYKKQTQFFYMKEVLWFAFFSATGSWSALAGVILFLFYGMWRKAWRKENAIKPQNRL